MNDILQQLAKHGYSVIFASVFGRQLCLPIPAVLVLLAAGSLAGNGRLNVAVVVGLGAIGCVLADLVWFEAGRRRGNDILHFILRFSSKPDATAARTTQLFTRYGARVLLVAKFVMGLDAVAPPLAGMSGTSRLRFMSFDFVGASLYAGLYAGLGYAFCTQLEKAVAYAGKMGEVLVAIVLLVVVVLVVRRLVAWHHFLRELRLARITPEELKRKLDGGEKIVIVDVRGCVLHRPSHAADIPGATRIDGHRLGKYKDTPIPEHWQGHHVVLYCSCPNENMSARVASLLRRKGIEHVHPLAGGLKSWRDRGFPVS